MTELKTLVLNCTLTPSPKSSSTELSETDGQGRMTTYDKVGLVALVGNEDGAHRVSAEVYQAQGRALATAQAAV